MAESYTEDLNRIKSELGKIQDLVGKNMDELSKKTKSYANSWSEVGKKIAGSFDPVAKSGKLIDQLQSQQADSASKQKGFEQETASLLQTKVKFLSDIARYDELNTRSNSALLSETQTRELQQLQEVKNKQGATAKLIREKLIDSKAQAVLEKENVARLEKQIDGESKKLSYMLLAKETLKLMFQIAGDYDKLLSDTAKAQGTTKDEINEQYGAIQKVNTGLSSNLASNQEILAGVTAIRKEYALNGPQLVAIGKEAANISRLTGLSADEAVKFQTSLAEISGTSLATQEAMTVVAAKAAEAFGVPMGQVMRDVANASASVRTIFKGNSAELIKQAAEARRLGTNLEAAAKSAESLLNFETSIGAELKASALLGQSLNFNESRRLAFSGDLIGAEKALQLEIEKVGDLDKLNYNQRKALAEATGKDFGELQKIQTQKKNLLEAEREFPEIAQKMRKAQEELAKLSKDGLESRRESLKKLLEEKTAETELQKLTQAKQAVLLNIGKLLQPLYALIMSTATEFYRLIAIITSFENPIDKWATSGVVAIGLLVASFFTLKLGIKVVLDFLGNALANTAASVGGGIGKGLTRMSAGIRSFGRALGGFPMAAIGKLALIMGILTLSVIGIAYAFSLLKDVSGEQMQTFTFALIVLGAALIGLAAALTFPPLFVGFAILTAGMLAMSLAAVGFGYAMSMTTPTITAIGAALTAAAPIFASMLSIFTALPAVVLSVAAALIGLALASPGLLGAALGIGAVGAAMVGLGVTLALFPTSELTRITTQLVALSEAASGIGVAAASLKQLSGIELPKIDIGGLAAVSLLGSVGKKEENSEIKAGLEALGAKFDALTNMMASGGIVVNLDGTKVNNALARSASTRGAYGQATIA